MQGSSDHAIYIIDAVKGTKKRTLYNKTSGHSEWVTCVAMMPDGKVWRGYGSVESVEGVEGA